MTFTIQEIPVALDLSVKKYEVCVSASLYTTWLIYCSKEHKEHGHMDIRTCMMYIYMIYTRDIWGYMLYVPSSTCICRRYPSGCNIPAGLRQCGKCRSETKARVINTENDLGWRYTCRCRSFIMYSAGWSKSWWVCLVNMFHGGPDRSFNKRTRGATKRHVYQYNRGVSEWVATLNDISEQ